MFEMEITTKCNLKCTICEHTYWQEPSRDMSFEQVKSVVDQFGDLKWVAFTGIGENFLHKDFLDMYRYIKAKNAITHIELYDTFYFIDEDVGGQLLDIGIEKIMISFDAATRQNYEKTRVGSDFDRVVSNISRFLRTKKERGMFFPEVAFHYIINRSNIHEVLSYIELVKSLGGDRIVYTRMLHGFEEVKHLVVDVPPELQYEAEEKGKRLGVRIDWNANVCERKMPIQKCTKWLQPFIYVSGDVVPCCAMNEGNIRDFQKSNSLGNVFQQPFRDIWYGEKFSQLRKLQHQNKVPALCRDCPIYTGDDKNG